MCLRSAHQPVISSLFLLSIGFAWFYPNISCSQLPRANRIFEYFSTELLAKNGNILDNVLKSFQWIHWTYNSIRLMCSMCWWQNSQITRWVKSQSKSSVSIGDGIFLICFVPFSLSVCRTRLPKRSTFSVWFKISSTPETVYKFDTHYLLVSVLTLCNSRSL